MNGTYGGYSAPQLLYQTSSYLNGNGLDNPKNFTARNVDIPRFSSPPIPARGAFATDLDTPPPRLAPGAPCAPPRPHSTRTVGEDNSVEEEFLGNHRRAGGTRPAGSRLLRPFPFTSLFRPPLRLFFSYSGGRRGVADEKRRSRRPGAAASAGILVDGHPDRGLDAVDDGLRTVGASGSPAVAARGRRRGSKKVVGA